MATSRGRTLRRLSENLFEEPAAFDFFQAVRILERLAQARAGEPVLFRVGEDRPDAEAVRFKSQPSLSFPANAIAQLQPLASRSMPLGEMTVTFMGVTGPTGVLPYHYTALLIRRIRDKDFSLRDFLDLFHHRALSFFYRAWTKYRLPIAYERANVPDGAEDGITWALYCLVGLGTAGLRRKLEIDDEALLFYGGHFAHHPRSAVALESLLRDYFAMPIDVLQLQGQWLHLPEGEQTLMPSPAAPRGLNHQLGVNVIVGDRVWDVQGKIRIRVGPLTYDQFQRFLPNGNGLRALSQLVRRFVGPELDFDVQLVLRADEVPGSRMGANQSFLGWNSWMSTQKFHRPAEDAVFVVDNPQIGLP